MKPFKQFVQELDIHKHKGDIAAVLHAAEQADDHLEPPQEKLIARWTGGSKEGLRAVGFGVYNTDPLEKAYKEHSDEYKQLAKAFKPVKDVIIREFGRTIMLFRSERTRKLSGDTHGGRTLLSYTSNPNFAEAHAYGMKVKNLDTPTEADAKKAVADFYKNGEVSIKWNGVGKKKIVKDPDGEGEKDGERWANVMDGEEIEFGDYIEDIIDIFMKHSKEWLEDVKSRLGDIVVEDVDVDDIIWVTDRAHQAEFIVVNKPRKQRPYLETPTD